MSPTHLGKLLVVGQFGLLGGLMLRCFSHAVTVMPGWWSYALWLSGFALSLWTLSANRPGNFNIRPEPKAGGHLVQTGPYRWIRHPMYTSVLLVAAGASAWLADLAGAAAWLALLAVLIAKSHLEERWLVERYSDYQTYRKGTWRLVPGIY